jgi:hypothetical protein
VASGRVSRGWIGRGGLHAMEPPYVLFYFSSDERSRVSNPDL